MRKPMRLAPMFAALGAILLGGGSAAFGARAHQEGARSGNVDVATYHDDNARTGQNLAETVLTPQDVNSAHFGKIAFFPVDGKVDAEPLYLSNLKVRGKLHDVVYVGTEADTLYAFEANTGKVLWRKSMLQSGETTSDNHRCSQITPQIGITSTPAIDRRDGKDGAIFVVAMTKDGAGHYHQRLHALDLMSGAEIKGSPVEVHATYPGTGADSQNGQVAFDPGQYAERAGLLLMNGSVYTAWTSHCDHNPYTGWVMEFNEATLARGPILNLTPNGSEGAIWMSGAGLAADSSGNIYLLDGNGAFDTKFDSKGFPEHGDYGNAFVKISTAGGRLKVADYFSMYNTAKESDADLDLGSGGVLLLPDLKDKSGKMRQLAVGAGKDTNIYVINRDNLGKFNSLSNRAIYEELTHVLPGGVWGMPAYFNDTIYYGSVGAPLKAFPIHQALVADRPSAVTEETFNYPGTTPSISANGSSHGIVWAVKNSKSAVLYAFDASDLKELYASDQAPNGRDNFGPGNKFITPMIANGKVFVGTTDGVAVFGLIHATRQ